MDLPLILAGPIARRLEQRSFAVWVATSKPATVKLSMWPGEVTAGTAETGTFDPGGEAAVGNTHTLRVGAQLHMAVVVAQAAGGQPFLPGQRYSYNLIFRPDVVADGVDARDLRSEMLLVNQPRQPALGYHPGVLPSIVTCPLTIDELVLVHGSCNRISAPGGPNLMFAIDGLVRDSLDGVPSPPPRPHQLWLTGDQVYADEIAAPLSPWLTGVGRELIGVDELIELHPPKPDSQPDPGPIRVPLDQATFPAGYRSTLMNEGAKVTTTEGASHLLGMTERVAMQLFLWSPVLWGDTVKLPPAAQVLRDKKPFLLEALEEPPPHLKPEQIGAALVYLTATLKTYGADIEFVRARKEAARESKLAVAYAAQVGVVRRALANVPTYFVFDDHDVTDDWNLCRLWVDRVLGNGLGRSVMRDGLVTFALFAAWGNDPGAWSQGANKALLDAVPLLFPDPVPGLPPGNVHDHRNPGPDETVAATLDHLLGFDGSPPEVRWNYTVDGATHRVIACDTRTRRGFTGQISPPVQLPDGERQRQVPEGPLEAGLELLVIVLSQPLLDPVMLGELMQGLLSGGKSAFANIQKATELRGYLDLGTKDRRALGGLEAFDYEGWSARPAEVARMLDRLATYPRVLIMSGDVHYAVSLGLSYWRHHQGLVSTIGQFTSSAVQYITYPEYLLPAVGQTWAHELLGLGYPADMLVWNDPAGPPLELPKPPSRGLRRRLLRHPVLLPVTGWPDRTEVTIPPDAAWRLQLLADTRDDSDRPEPVRAEMLVAEFDAGDPIDGINGYAALARRHSTAVRRHANTRRIAIYNKIARLTFRHEGTRLVARSELFAVDHYNESAAPPAPFTMHELFYDEDQGTPEPTIGGV
jgi:hypothetical protein